MEGTIPSYTTVFFLHFSKNIYILVICYILSILEIELETRVMCYDAVSYSVLLLAPYIKYLLTMS